MLENASDGPTGSIVVNPGLGFYLMTILTLTTGTAFIMWLGEQISERGIGNGISLIIYAGIVVGLPGAVVNTIQKIQQNTLSWFAVIAMLVMMVLVVAAIVFVERAQRRIPIQYARRVVGRRVYGGASTYLPLRVNTGGVIPVIFASSMLAIPMTIGSFFPDAAWLQNGLRQVDYATPLYDLLYFTLIIFFCFFYVSIIFNPLDQADNMKKYGGFIPGIRPGKNTAEYIDRILTRLTFGGALYLGLVSLLPIFLTDGLRLGTLPGIGPTLGEVLPGFITQGLRVEFFFGGTALLIVVGVAMDTVQQIESQLIMRHYEGFLKGTRIRGRRG
jgi:preprotein translocase subunit SecY